MLLRAPVSRLEIEDFLQRLGEGFSGAGRVYLVGGTSLVYENIRQQTLDIDLMFEVAPEEFIALIGSVRELREELDVNVEEASPGTLIPLPAGYGDRHSFVGRFGQLDVFHFDFYSASLSKLARGREQDYQDVLALLRQNRIEWPMLKALYQEILPQMGLKTLNQDPFELELNFNALETQWRSAGGNP